MELFDFSPSSSDDFGDPLLPGKLNLFEFSNEQILSSSHNSSPQWGSGSTLEEDNSDFGLMDESGDDFLFKTFNGQEDLLVGALLLQTEESKNSEEEASNSSTSSSNSLSSSSTARIKSKSILHCNLCKLVFTESRDLARHTLNFVTRNTCCLCQKSFPTSAKLTIHHRRHIREKPFECEFCFKTFTHSNTLNRHRIIYCDAVRQRCKDLLGEEISNALLPPPLRAAERRAIEAPKTTLPPPCPKLSPRSETQCKVCDKEMFDSESLQNHVDFYLGSRTCCRCSKVLGNRSKLLTHHRSHTKELPYSCSYCSKKFSETSTLRKHEATHGEKKFVCGDCGKSFVRKDYLVKHSHAVHRQTYKCSRCSYVCHKEEDIRVHVDAVHSFE
ncbi:zinc finger protein 711 [Lepeophtheirus salmonis]|uniref:Zinc finger protein 271like [Chrysemys picta] n=1 Tax=Lepeophtheirus salmonis TaxID=72036 RepID=A0A0K2UQH4_LEPSM|nr:zinc finger protein 354B-like [Lepeophtheirus salmonis]